MQKLDKNSAQPLYAQLEAIIKENIMAGIWPPDHKIPSENELGTLYNISRMTVRLVITQLVNKGFLYRVQGKGTFVCQPKIITRSQSTTGIRQQLEESSNELTMRLLRVERMPVPDSIQNQMNLKAQEEVFLIERLRLLKDVPVSLHYCYIPCRLAPTLMHYDLENKNLQTILKDDFDLKLSHVKETLESVSATAAEALQLSVKKGHSLLLVDELMADDSGQIIKYVRIFFRGDMLKLNFDYWL